ncbi:MAG: hypothetical protein QM744_02810 [Mesorhizobium sp.]
MDNRLSLKALRIAFLSSLCAAISALSAPANAGSTQQQPIVGNNWLRMERCREGHGVIDVGNLRLLIPLGNSIMFDVPGGPNSSALTKRIDAGSNELPGFCHVPLDQKTQVYEIHFTLRRNNDCYLLMTSKFGWKYHLQWMKNYCTTIEHDSLKPTDFEYPTYFHLRDSDRIYDVNNRYMNKLTVDYQTRFFNVYIGGRQGREKIYVSPLDSSEKFSYSCSKIPILRPFDGQRLSCWLAMGDPPYSLAIRTTVPLNELDRLYLIYLNTRAAINEMQLAVAAF